MFADAEYIGIGAFAKYSSLETMTIPDNVEEYYGSAEVETPRAVVAFGEDISQSA